MQDRYKKFLLPTIAFAVLLSIWQTASYLSSHLFLILPSPLSVGEVLIYKYDRFLFHSSETLKVMLGGCCLAFFVAFPFAWIMSLWDEARLVLQPLFVITQCIPMFALAPIMVVWFGWFYTAILIPTALMIFFPLTMNIYQGLRSTPAHLLDYFRSHQATTCQIFFKLQLPWALPHIFAGLRISAAIAGIGAIAGEWAGAQTGLGLLMLDSRRGAELEVTFGALFCLTLISLILYGGITLMERWIFSRKFVHLAKKGTLALIATLSLTLTSCSSQSDKETRLALDWLPNPNHVPIYVGIEKGFFKQNEIDLKVIKIRDASDPLPYLAARQVELSISYEPSILRAIAKGGKFKPIGILIPEPLNALIYRTNDGIANLSDINGRTIGYCIDGSGRSCLDYILNVNRIVPKDKKNVSFDLVSTLGNNQVDVVYGAFWNIECEQLRFLGINTDYFKLTDLGVPNYCELVVVAQEGSPQAQKDFIDRFQRSLQASIDYCKEYPRAAFDIYLKANPDKGEKTAIWELAAWMRTYPILPKKQVINEQEWALFANWLAQRQIR